MSNGMFSAVGLPKAVFITGIIRLCVRFQSPAILDQNVGVRSRSSVNSGANERELRQEDGSSVDFLEDRIDNWRCSSDPLCIAVDLELTICFFELCVRLNARER